MIPRTNSHKLLTYLQQNGPTASRELVSYFGISRPTLSRRVKELGDAIVTVGKARATTLAARRAAIPETQLYRVHENGQSMLAGHLVPLQAGERTQWLLRDSRSPKVFFSGEFSNGLYPGWPWFLEDLRPSGFLGRAFGKRMARLFQIDPNPGNWDDLELVTTLIRFGSNLQGDLILGDSMALDDFQADKLKDADGYYQNNIPQIYPELARRAIAEDDYGSSAGGEQPKFTTMIRDEPEAAVRSVIVKFSPEHDTPLGQRWSDLLHAEHLAQEVLTEVGFATARTRIFTMQGRTYLESCRFDRVGPFGRRGLVTLRSLDAAFVGMGSGSWSDVARMLHADKWVSEAVRDRMIQLHCFGQMIANTDMHWGNLSFFVPEAAPFPLAPVYDMLPMLFRPSGTGEIISRHFEPKLPKPEDRAAWLAMYPHARHYWKQVAQASEFTADFRQIAKDAIASLQRVHAVADT